MQLDRNAIDREGSLDREGGIGIPALLAAYLDSETSVYGRLQIEHLLLGYPDTDSSVYNVLLQSLAAYTDTDSSIFSRLRIDQNLSGYPDTETSVYGRFQITQLLSVPDICSTPSYYGREQLDRAGLDRRYTRETLCQSAGTASSVYARLQLTNLLSAILDTDSSVYGRLRLDQLLQSTIDTESSVWGVLLQALASYIDSESSVYARLQIGHNMSAISDTESDVYARLQLTHLLAALTDTDSSVYGRLQITHNLGAISDTESDVYAMLRQVDSWTITFTGTLAAGQTVCINTRDYTVKNNGVNAIADFSGDFPLIFPGTNWVVYTDAEGSRTIRLVVSKRDRKV